MREFILKNKISVSLFVLSFLLVFIAWWAAYAKLHAITQPLIIHFNSQEGINQIGSMGDLTGVAVLSLVIVIVNGMIFLELQKRDWLWGNVLAAATALYCALIFIGFWVIIGVN